MIEVIHDNWNTKPIVLGQYMSYDMYTAHHRVHTQYTEPHDTYHNQKYFAQTFGNFPPRRVNFVGFFRYSTTSSSSCFASSQPLTSLNVLTFCK